MKNVGLIIYDGQMIHTSLFVNVQLRNAEELKIGQTMNLKI